MNENKNNDVLLRGDVYEEAVELQTFHAGRKVWLIKVPDYIAKEWRSVCGSQEDVQATTTTGKEGDDEDDDLEDGGRPVGPVLGTLKIRSSSSISPSGQREEQSIDVKGESKYSNSKSMNIEKRKDRGPAVLLTLSHESTSHLPQEYDLALSSRPGPAMLAFSERHEGMSRAVEGTVQHRLDVDARSHGVKTDGGREHGSGLNEEYRRLARERFRAEDSIRTQRRVKVMTDSKIIDIRKPVGLEVGALGMKKKAQKVEKRIASSREELLPVLFRLFQKQGRWSFSQLQKETEQPTQHLKKVLLEIAVQNKAGPYKDLWELSKESQIHVVL
jgi:hypothetical protein